MNARNPIVKATFIVFLSIWIPMNLYTLCTDPVFFWENIPNMIHGAFVTVVGCIMGVVITAGLILLERSLAQMRLQGGSFNGVTSSIGPVPILAPPAKRAKAKECLPIESERVKQWIEANKVAHPEYVTLFMAIWQTLSAHKTHPASHRKGGHGGRTLAQHCMAVADTALELAPRWSYEGVYIRRPGKSPKLIIAKRNANYVFDPLDPIIPVLALAHDLGKIEAYKLQADGTVLTSESGVQQDDPGVKHDALGARMLARISEFWELSSRDTEALTTVIAHYHHPSDFPVDKNGLSRDDRMTALLEFLILADKTTGQRESGISAATANEDTISETEADEIYTAFVSCVTEKGRINGSGDRETDRTFKIGQKHANLVYLRDGQLLAAICRKLGVSIEIGRGRFILLKRILHILEEKGLLYSTHNGVNFKQYLPLFLVRFYHSESTTVIADWHQTIVITPTAKHTELLTLVDMPALATVAKVEAPYFSHLNNVPNPLILLEMVRKAFGDEVVSVLDKGIFGAGLHQTAGQQAQCLEPSLGIASSVLFVSSLESVDASQSNKGALQSSRQSGLNPSSTVSTVLPQAVPSKHPQVIALPAVEQPASSNQNIDWKNLDEDVKKNGFDTAAVAESKALNQLSPAALEDLPSVDASCDDSDPLVSDTSSEITPEDLDLVASVIDGENSFSGYCEASDLAETSGEVGLPLSPEVASADNETGKQDIRALGIPEQHEMGTAVQDVPKDPVSDYKKQKQADRNSKNLAQLRQTAKPAEFLELLSSSKAKKQAGSGLSAYLGAGNDLRALVKAKATGNGLHLDAAASDAMKEVIQQKAYLVFQKLIQRAVESGTLHCLATIDAKYFILESMIEKAFPEADINERLPTTYVERRTTSAGTVLIIPVATTTYG
ncbi:hypothetical protein KTQ42_19540 [Noviherbaspirillum sp. L7-7A]|uniref:HD domain-containing protein n=1 Tax=Noviherbaspirillum sp. L7-7A TaxID=2850560 RepID=UPI001C2CC139|nr:HD domain-containing protein [Noviherbaspirillum sp. L7-7A]MBV0881484.1 hypothetical protein [Noviherbaspirillum sp. L7-7A]